MKARPSFARLTLGLGLGLVLALLGCGSTAPEPSEASPAPRPSTQPEATPAPSAQLELIDIAADLQDLEEDFEARVGVSALDTSTGTRVTYRAEERFGFASTIKVFAVAELLRQTSDEQLARHVTWTADEVSTAGFSPVTSEHIAEGLTLAELAEAAMRQSDNTATNLVLDALGGPDGLQQGLEELGDTTTRITDWEPGLNIVGADGTANTTSPSAFTANLRELLESGHLVEADRTLLREWMSGNATGDALVRAGAPVGWVVADKSGGAGGTRNDVAIVTPPGRDPILVTILTERHDPAARYDDALVARSAESVLTALE